MHKNEKLSMHVVSAGATMKSIVVPPGYKQTGYPGRMDREKLKVVFQH